MIRSPRKQRTGNGDITTEFSLPKRCMPADALLRANQRSLQAPTATEVLKIDPATDIQIVHTDVMP
jgi:hypothetical protein